MELPQTLDDQLYDMIRYIPMSKFTAALVKLCNEDISVFKLLTDIIAHETKNTGYYNPLLPVVRPLLSSDNQFMPVVRPLLSSDTSLLRPLLNPDNPLLRPLLNPDNPLLRSLLNSGHILHSGRSLISSTPQFHPSVGGQPMGGSSAMTAERRSFPSEHQLHEHQFPYSERRHSQYPIPSDYSIPIQLPDINKPPPSLPSNDALSRRVPRYDDFL